MDDPRLQIGRMLIVFGVLMIALGLAVFYADKIPFLGRLPGDITIRGKNWTFYFPLATGILLSILLTLLLNLFFRR